MSFRSLGLSDILLRAVAAQGYTAPTPIQSQAIPAILSGRDLLGAADTAHPVRRPRALILVPTRELAAQLSDSVRVYGRHTDLRWATIFGGVSMQSQITTLRRGVDILIATPGRLLDLVGQGHANLAGISFLILDEADRMLDMGFIHDLKRILGLLPKVRQNLLFSATFSEDIRKLAAGLLHQPLGIEVAPRNAPATAVSQSVYHVPQASKAGLLAHLVSHGRWGQTLVFTRTKHGANKLAEQLDRDGFQVAVIHGNKSQSARTQALAAFKENRVHILVATDIAARGLDIHQLPHVVNFELPHVPEDYVHRIGRTGRAGADGAAVSPVCREEASQLRDIERLLGRRLPAEPVPGAMLPSAKPDPARSPAARNVLPRSDNRAGSRHGNSPTRRAL